MCPAAALRPWLRWNLFELIRAGGCSASLRINAERFAGSIAQRSFGKGEHSARTVRHIAGSGAEAQRQTHDRM
jgi:hypothetical protein